MQRIIQKQFFQFSTKSGPLKVCIVGGVAGGASCAARLRRLSEDCEITMFEKGEYISFANCGLPYYIGDVIKDRSKLLVQTVEGMSQRFNLDIRNYSEVVQIDRKQKKVQVTNSQTKETYWENYDKLVLSPGAFPFKPTTIPGIDNEKIFTLRNIPDTDHIKDFCDKNDPKHAVVIGGGFIGLEMVEMLNHRGIKVTLVELADHIMTPLDYEMACLVHQHLKLKGIEVYLHDGVTSVDEVKEKKTKFCGDLNLNLQSGEVINADMVILSIGVKPDTQLAKKSGIDVNRGIITNSKMQTSDRDIYAVGDAVEVQNIVTQHSALIPLAGPANKQGRIVADQIMGKNSLFKGSQGTGIVKIFDISAGSTGCNERQLQDKGIKYEKSITHQLSHAEYYPGAYTTAVKILFSPNDGTLLGAQVVGADMVDKRLDVLAVAIRNKMTVFDLEELELSYAPPFSSAKDPVNYAGFVGSNIINGLVQVAHWDEIKNDENVVLVDLRTKKEYEMGSVPGAINVELDHLREKLGEIDQDKKVVVFCQTGLRAYIGYSILRNNGFKNIYNLSGGFKTWHYASLKQSNEHIIFCDDFVKSENSKHTQNMIYKDYKNFSNPLNSNYVYWDPEFQKEHNIIDKKE